jgi:hypothetical protein
MEVQIDPTSKELMAIIGCLWGELDDLRERVAKNPVIFNKRVFTYHDLINGASLGIRARVLRDGKIEVFTDS